MRRFPAPWTLEPIEAGFKVIDANGQSIAYVYGHTDKRDAETTKGLTLAAARDHTNGNLLKGNATLMHLDGRGVCR